MIACSLKEIKKPKIKTKSMRLSCKITNRASPSPALLALLPLRDQVQPLFVRRQFSLVTQKRTQMRQAYDPHFCLSLAASYQERDYIEPFWIALTLKEKRHYEVS